DRLTAWFLVGELELRNRVNVLRHPLRAYRDEPIPAKTGRTDPAWEVLLLSAAGKEYLGDGRYAQLTSEWDQWSILRPFGESETSALRQQCLEILAAHGDSQTVGVLFSGIVDHGQMDLLAIPLRQSSKFEKGSLQPEAVHGSLAFPLLG